MVPIARALAIHRPKGWFPDARLVVRGSRKDSDNRVEALAGENFDAA